MFGILIPLGRCFHKTKMNVFKMHRGYREIGVGYGLPVFYVDVGFGVKYDPADLIKRLAVMGLNVGSWVVIRNNPLKEQGIGLFVEGLKACKVKVEMEDDGSQVAPGWFPKVDRWMVWWRDNFTFNYGALRPRQDMLIYEGEDIEGFLIKSKDFPPLKAVVTNEDIFDRIKDFEVRVYAKRDSSSR